MKLEICWDKTMSPMKKAWNKVSKKIAERKAGHMKLKRDIRTCEYEDVHILWGMLKRNDSDITKTRKEGGTFNELARWAKHAPLIRRTD